MPQNVSSSYTVDSFPSCFAGAAATFRGIGMASLVILLIFSFIQCLTGETEEKGGKTLTSSIQTCSFHLIKCVERCKRCSSFPEGKEYERGGGYLLYVC